jgi:hypothetical protein
MQFQNSFFLISLLLLALPIVLHFWSIRAVKTQFFSHVALLKKVLVTSKKESQLRNKLLLLTRLLALAFLVFTFCKPFFERNAAQNLGKSLAGSETSVDLSCSVVSSPDMLGKVLMLLKNADKTSETVLSESNCEQQAAFASEYIKSSSVKRQVVASDFQKGFWDMGDNKSITPTTLVHLGETRQTPNVFVDSLWLNEQYVRVGLTNNVTLQLENSGVQENEHVLIELKVGNTSVSSQTVAVMPKSKIKFSLPILVQDTNAVYCQIRVDDGSWTFDNVFHFVLKATTTLPISVLADKERGKAFKTAYDQEKVFACQVFDNPTLTYLPQKESNLYIVNTEEEPNPNVVKSLLSKAKQGSAVVLMPSPKWSKNVYDLLNMEMGKEVADKQEVPKNTIEMELPNVKHPFFANVFENMSVSAQMPSVLPTAVLKGSNNVILKTADGQPALAEYWCGAGRLYLFSFALGGQETFSRNALFLPVFYRIAEKSARNQLEPYYRKGQKLLEISLPSDQLEDAVLSLEQEGLKMVPEQRVVAQRVQVYLPENILSGVWKVNDKKGGTVATVALNIDKSESMMEFYTLAELKEKCASQANVQVVSFDEYKDASENLSGKATGWELWRYAVAISFLFLLAEILVARFLRKKAAVKSKSL